MRGPRLAFALLFSLAAVAQQTPAPSKLSSFDLQRAHMMLRQAHDEVQKNYYDATFHGTDFEKNFQQYDQRMNSAQSVNETFRIIAAFLTSLHDSHTFFLPPARQNRSTPGFEMDLVGTKCLITRIRPGSDAAAKLHVGDQVLALNGFNIKPAAFHDMEYFFQVLSPAATETLDLVSPTGEQRKEVVKELVKPGKAILDLASGNDSDYYQLVRGEEEEAHLSRERLYESGDAIIWKMPSFEVDANVINSAMAKVMKHKTLIVDLRGNPGGYVNTLKEMLGRFFDHDVKLGDVVTRKDTKAEMVKARKPTFTGDVIVLVDSRSASAAELFARVIQLEKRGKVLGDHSAGAVMQARGYTEQVGGDYAVFYGFSVTSANVLMTDGKSLETVGVTPDEVLLPTADDLAQGRDPVLARAAAMAGMKLDAAAAGKLFPFEWADL